ncbi:MAG: hypothetical protein Q7S52_04835 [bacterium]|nr:hypothetical protein [bacterium]
MSKGVNLLILGLIIGGIVGFFFHSYKYELQLEAGRNWDAGQFLDTIVYNDLTDRVEIICGKGNGKTFQAKDVELGGGIFGLQEKMSLYFSERDFDENGKYDGDKNFLLQRVCDIPKATDEDLDKWTGEATSGEEIAPDPYFEVILRVNADASSVSPVDPTNPLGI